MEIRNNYSLTSYHQNFGMKLTDDFCIKVSKGMEYFSDPSNMDEFIQEQEEFKETSELMMDEIEDETKRNNVLSLSYSDNFVNPWYKKLFESNNRLETFKELVGKKMLQLQDYKSDENFEIAFDNSYRNTFYIARETDDPSKIHPRKRSDFIHNLNDKKFIPFLLSGKDNYLDKTTKDL